MNKEQREFFQGVFRDIIAERDYHEDQTVADTMDNSTDAAHRRGIAEGVDTVIRILEANFWQELGIRAPE